MKITSLANPKIKEVVKLKDRRDRERSGLTLVEGIREVSRAKESGMTFKEIFLCDEYLQMHSGRLPSSLTAQQWIEGLSVNDQAVYETSKDVFEKVSFGDRREGIVAVCLTPKRALTDFRCPPHSFFLVLEQIEKPGNLGAILRTGEAAGVHAVFVSDPAIDVYNPNVIRASVGTVFSLPVFQADEQEISGFLRKNKVKIYAASPKAESLHTAVDLSVPCAMVLGSEEKGLSDFWLENADAQMKIPMQGRVDSLNVSVTAAILLYEAQRQRTVSRATSDEGRATK